MPPLSNGNHKISRSLPSAAAASRMINDHGGSGQEESGSFRPGVSLFRGLERLPFRVGKGKRLSRSARGQQCSVGFLVAFLFCVVAFTILGSNYLLSFGRSFAGVQNVSISTEFSDDQETYVLFPHAQSESKRVRGISQSDTDLAGKNLNLFSRSRGQHNNDDNVGSVHFGKIADQNEGHRDSRYWDSDDRKREMSDGSNEKEASRLLQDMVKNDVKNENIKDGIDLSNLDIIDSLQEKDIMKLAAGSHHPKHAKSDGELNKGLGKAPNKLSGAEDSGVLVKSYPPDNSLNLKDDIMHKYKEGHMMGGKVEDGTFKNLGLFNERARKELTGYEHKFQSVLNISLNDNTRSQKLVDQADGEDDGDEDTDEDDEDETVFSSASNANGSVKDGNLPFIGEGRADDKQHKLGQGVGQVTVPIYLKTKGESNRGNQLQQLVEQNAVLGTTSDIFSDGNYKVGAIHKPIPTTGRVSEAPPDASIPEPKPSQGQKRRKHSGTACKIDFLNSVALAERNLSTRFLNFSLNFVIREERPWDNSEWKPLFAGHQTLLEREISFKAGDTVIHCGFVEGPTGFPSTGFELSESDTKILSTCRIVVLSCIFGNSDYIRSPDHKKVTPYSREKVCFVMFVDQKSLDAMIDEGHVSQQNQYVGLWKLVLVKNLPYSDARRTGKVPKFLSHRLFPSARYSIWIDSKLRLISDPLLILEHFLWRGGYEYAISNHYDRHCVSEEVQQNKKLNKFNHTAINGQYAFYQQDGLLLFNASDPNRLLPSYVPEGSFIIRAHTPMSNLFSCLWFNEVDRFTPRDQLSFAYTYFKLLRTNPRKHFHLHMFKDCERKAMAKLFHHKKEKLL